MVQEIKRNRSIDRFRLFPGIRICEGELWYGRSREIDLLIGSDYFSEFVSVKVNCGTGDQEK